jgi:hypothetical protein
MAEKTVSLVMVTKIPGIGLAAILRKKSAQKDRRKFPPFVFEIAISGKLDKGEDFLDFLPKAIESDFGKGFLAIFWKKYLHTLVNVHPRHDTSRKIYAVKVGFDSLSKIRLKPHTGSVQFLYRENINKVVDILDPKRKKSDVALPIEIKEAIALAFKYFA